MYSRLLHSTLALQSLTAPLAPALSNQGVKSDFGNINNNLYFSTVIAGSVRLITLNNQIPFHKGTPQYTWALKQFKSVDRDVTPWLFVMVHASPYHTWFKHYKVTFVGIRVRQAQAKFAQRLHYLVY